MKPDNKIARLLAERFPPPEWVLGFEVRDSTGFGASRAADAVAMNCYPSKGLEVHGFEVKIARSDWLRELRDGEKAETMAKFCDRWWIVAPPGVVVREELPKTWGLMIVGDGGLRQSVAAPELSPPDALARPFVAAFLRGVLTRAIKPGEDALREARNAGRAEGEADAKRRSEGAERRAEKRADALEAAIREFEGASGLRISQWDAGDIGAAVRALREMGGVHHSALAQAEHCVGQLLAQLAALRQTLEPKVAEPAVQP